LNATWRVGLGGTGFAPPYVCPSNPTSVTEFQEDVPVTMKDKVYNIKAKTAEKFLENMHQRWQKPAIVFCSREMEEGLNKLVREEQEKGSFPTDDALKARARDILGVEHTSAEDTQLLAKFKAMHGYGEGTPHPAEWMSLFPGDEQFLADFDNELSNMDLSNVDIPSMSSSLDIMDVQGARMLTHAPVSNSPPQISLLSQSLASRSHILGDGYKPPSKGPGMAPDFAEMAKVHAATASPLRRRASAKMVEQAGFEMPPVLVELLQQHGSMKDS